MYVHSFKMLTLNEMYKKVVQNNGKEMDKKVCCTCKVASLLISPSYLLFFTILSRFLRCSALHDFIFFLNKLKILSRALLLALAKSIYY